MTLEEALRTALSYETRIRDMYRDSAGELGDPIGRKVFLALADDEQRHVDYLESRLAIWEEKGVLDLAALETIVPSAETLKREMAKLAALKPGKSLGDEKRVLSRALAMEVETSDFYRSLTQTLESPGRELFARFQEIEDGHIATVQAELDYLSHSGFWFDFQEFDME
ncbi:MAG: rubrerythrin [Pseudomonadota bacterium]